MAALRAELADYQNGMTRAFARARVPDERALGAPDLAEKLRGFDDGWFDGRNRLIDSFGSAIEMIDSVVEQFDHVDSALRSRFGG